MESRKVNGLPMRSVACGSSLSGFLAYKEEFLLRTGDGRTMPRALQPFPRVTGTASLTDQSRLAVRRRAPSHEMPQAYKVRGIGMRCYRCLC
jgi:hypothetical protein